MKFRIACMALSDPALVVLKERLADVHDIVRADVVAKDASYWQAELIDLCDRGNADCIITSGGTGLQAGDRMPQATAAIVDFEIPGIAEAIRAAASKHNASAMLSRVFTGVRHKTLIVNLPGNPKALAEALDVVLPILPAALESIV